MIKCYDCGARMVKKTGYVWEDENLGEFSIPDTVYHECKKCGEQEIPLEIFLEMEKQEQARISQCIYKYANSIEELFCDFLLDNNELSESLGVTKQAISKNGKYRTLIYHCIVKGKIYYFEPSVKAFIKSGGDGRIKLDSIPEIESTYYTDISDTVLDDISIQEEADTGEVKYTTNVSSDIQTLFSYKTSPPQENTLPSNLPTYKPLQSIIINTAESK
jgi:hypothetical protein